MRYLLHRLLFHLSEAYAQEDADLMQEEVTQKTIALVIKTAKLDANVLKAAMRMYLNHRRQKHRKRMVKLL